MHATTKREGGEGYTEGQHPITLAAVVGVGVVYHFPGVPFCLLLCSFPLYSSPSIVFCKFVFYFCHSLTPLHSTRLQILLFSLSLLFFLFLNNKIRIAFQFTVETVLRGCGSVQRY